MCPPLRVCEVLEQELIREVATIRLVAFNLKPGCHDGDARRQELRVYARQSFLRLLGTACGKSVRCSPESTRAAASGRFTKIP